MFAVPPFPTVLKYLLSTTNSCQWSLNAVSDTPQHSLPLPPPLLLLLLSLPLQPSNAFHDSIQHQHMG
jgi:hypothetical protein